MGDPAPSGALWGSRSIFWSSTGVILLPQFVAPCSPTKVSYSFSYKIDAPSKIAYRKGGQVRGQTIEVKHRSLASSWESQRNFSKMYSPIATYVKYWFWMSWLTVHPKCYGWDSWICVFPENLKLLVEIPNSLSYTSECCSSLCIRWLSLLLLWLV